VAMTAREIDAGAVKLRDPPPAGGPARQTRANEKRPRPAEAARNVGQTNRLLDLLPTPAVEADAIAETQPVLRGAQVNPRDPLPVARPFRRARPAGLQAALAM